MTAVLIAVLINAAYLWVPPNVSYIFVGKSKLQKAQFRLAILLTVAVLLNLALYKTTFSALVFLLGFTNWVLMIVCLVKRDNTQKDQTL
ncbi:MAG: hypothetical protein MI976_26690 [Pseudomonadales bacterium]|nr:hypothetical protein [Pseudomonadales bacterium]